MNSLVRGYWVMIMVVMIMVVMIMMVKTDRGGSSHNCYLLFE